jgi:branched-subunit amino acid aminotransferase/4-amino-4-deoxychorismate lyase
MSLPLALVLDGAAIPADRAAFLPTERGLLYGDGLFETIPLLHGVALDAPRHLARLAASSQALGLPAPPPPRTIAAWIGACIAAAGPLAAVLRLTWTRGAGGRGFAPAAADGPPHLLIAAFAARADAATRHERGVRAALVRGLVPGDLARHKTLSALPYVVAADRARAQGADEALIVDGDGNVLEAAGANVFAIDAGRAVTPPAAQPLLAGIGRARALAWLGSRGGERVLPVAALATATEAFLTNAVAGIVPLVQVDGRNIGAGSPGPVTRELQELDRAWRTNPERNPVS